MQGWISDKAESLIPAPSVNFGREMEGRVAFATLFSLSAEVVPGDGRLASDGGELSWRTEAGAVRLTIERDGERVRVVES